MSDTIEQERIRFETQRRHIYRWAGVVGVFMVLYTQYAEFQDKELAYLPRAVYALNHILLAGLCVAVVWILALRKLPIVKVERLVLVFFVGQSLIFNSLAPLAFGNTPESLLRETIRDDIWFLLIICTLAVHLFQIRRGTLMSVAVYSISFAIVALQAVWWVLNGADDGNSALIIQIYVMAGALLGFMVILASYRERAQRLQAEYRFLANIAYSDPLTDLPNRRRLYEELRHLIAEAERYGYGFSVCLFDLDRFKQINDQYGHLVGDQVLQETARQTRQLMRVVDLFGRWGGEEFIILLPQTDLAGAKIAIERVRVMLAAIDIPEMPHITASFGLAQYVPGDTSETILQRADQALYDAKARGRNCIIVRDLVEWSTSDSSVAPV